MSQNRSGLLGVPRTMADDGGVLPVVQGRVKWFDPVKGFGFVVAEGLESDALLHANVLRNFGQGSVADGSLIEVRIQHTGRGIQAVEVLSIEPPPPGATDRQLVLPGDDILSLPLEPARVKWFDKGKGFGFANVFGHPEDVFIHVEVLRQSGLADLAAGEAVVLRTVEGKRGRMAAQVLAWESASRQG